MIVKAQDKINEKLEQLQKEIKTELTENMNKSFDESNLKNQGMVHELRNQTHSSLVEVDKKLAEAKQDVGKQMHEICSMVEQIAGMTRGLE